MIRLVDRLFIFSCNQPKRILEHEERVFSVKVVNACDIGA